MRLFVSLRPPAVAVEHLQAVLPRWGSAPERWHVTLAFLGEVDEPEPVADRLRTVAGATTPFSLALRGSGTFGRSGPVWVGVAGDLGPLRSLAGDVVGACRAAGVRLEDRPWRPHLTVGRRGHPDPRVLATYAGPSWPVREVELVRSTLGRTVTHTVLERFALTGYQA